MSRRVSFAILSLLILGAFSFSPAAARKSAEERPQHFKKWLDEDVVYIITPEEKGIFRKLTTDEEREQFIEQFWQRRDPNPLTVDNEFKIEHYRRIAYANDHYQSGKAGWKTDRGHIYILFGPPNEIQTNPSGHVYNRDMNQGGGHTTTFPYEVWFYRNIEGIGSGVEIEFVDASMSGEYRMAISPEEKDALLYASGTGNTLLEEMGYENREDRIRNMGIKNVSGNTMFRWGELNHAMDRYTQFFQLRRPPEIQFKDLQQLVNTKISYSILPADLNWDYIQLSPGRFMIALTLGLPNSALGFKEIGLDRHQAKVEVYGLIQSLSGKIVYEFEDTIVKELSTAQLTNPRGTGNSLYQRSAPMIPGRFKLTVVLKDTKTGNTSVLERSFHLPAPPENALFTSSLFIGDRVTPAGKGELLTDPFILEGNLKLYPNVGHKIRNGTSVSGYIEVYNLAVDEKTLKPDWDISVELFRGDQPVDYPRESISQMFPIFKGDKLVLFWIQSLKLQEAGPYDLKVSVTDKIRGHTASASSNVNVY